jgi:hypothetical protein
MYHMYVCHSVHVCVVYVCVLSMLMFSSSKNWTPNGKGLPIFATSNN